MSSPFVAEIRIFASNFAPMGWAQCNGQIMDISQNTTLFSYLGTMYGGDGRTTFALPNLQDSVPIGPGQGPGLSLRDQGEQGGSASVALVATEMPGHTHQIMAVDAPADWNNPGSTLALATPRTNKMYVATPPLTPLVAMHGNALDFQGSGLPHENRQPFLTLNFCIALQGDLPTRP